MELELELKCTSDELKVPPARSVTKNQQLCAEVRQIIDRAQLRLRPVPALCHSDSHWRPFRGAAVIHILFVTSFDWFSFVGGGSWCDCVMRSCRISSSSAQCLSSTAVRSSRTVSYLPIFHLATACAPFQLSPPLCSFVTSLSACWSGASGTGTIATFGDRFLNDGMVHSPPTAD